MNLENELLKLIHEVAELRAQVAIMWRVMSVAALVFVTDTVTRIIAIIRNGKCNGGAR